MPTLRFRAWDFFTGLWVAFAVAALTALLFHATGTMPILRNPKFDLAALLVLAVVGLVGIFVQAGAEELLYRGYFTQFARRFTSSPILFLGIPALLFAAPHISNVAALGGSPLVMVPVLDLRPAVRVGGVPFRLAVDVGCAPPGEQLHRAS